MDDAVFGRRDRAGHWRPFQLIAYPDVFVWLAKPMSRRFPTRHARR